MGPGYTMLRPCYLFETTEKEEQFILKTDNHELWLEVIIFSLLGVVATN